MIRKKNHLGRLAMTLLFAMFSLVAWSQIRLMEYKETAKGIACSDNSNKKVAKKTTSTKPYTQTGLNKSTTPGINMRATKGDDESGSTDPVSLTTLAPTDLAAGNISADCADITWTGTSDADSYVLRYRECGSTTATIILTTDDVWGDGSGYQMLLDPTASTYGDVIPERGALASGDAEAAVYDRFAYKIPEDADGSRTTEHMVLDSCVAITVPAGTYDWCITNPTPGDRIWIASEGGSVGGRANDFVFEAGKIYEFHVYLGDNGNDATDLNVTEDFSALIDPDAWIVINDATSPTGLTGLNPETRYAVQVQAVYDDNTSEWSDIISFTTLALDAVPTNLIAENITHRSAELNWSGAQDTYDLRWRTRGFSGIFFSEDWDTNLADWTTYNLDSNSGISDQDGVNGTRCLAFHYTTTPPQYAVSPELTYLPDGSKLSFSYRNYSATWPESFMVGFSTTTNDVDAFTWSEEITLGKDTEWHVYESQVLPVDTKYFCIQCTSYDQYYFLVDNITITCPEIPEGEWQYANDVTSPFVIDNLEMDTQYEWQVMGNNPDTDWSEAAIFITEGKDYKIFFADGDWNDDDNWNPAGAPTLDDHVIVRADAIIPSGYIATSGAIYVEGGSITIKDGGELKSGNHGVPVTLEKEIPAGQYCLVASPFYTLLSPSSVEGLMTIGCDYDLYGFDATEDDEWRNFKGHEADDPTMDPCYGYLYANEEGTTLKFTGQILASINNPHHLSMSFNEGTDFYNGWMLVGNPYACTAYIYYTDENNDFQDCSFYKLNGPGTFDIYSKAVKLAPGEAAFIKVDFSDYIYFSTENLGPEPERVGETDYPVMPAIMWAEDDQDAAPTFYLADGDENTDMIDSADGYSGIKVGIDGRTIYTDGNWNTICLPFDLTLEGSPLEGATALPFAGATVEDDVLNLDFGDPVTTLAAGTPYIIKWSPALSQNIVNPVFRLDEVLDADETPKPVEVDGVITFIGTYAPVTFDGENRSVLLLGGDNKLFYPDGLAPSYVNAFRGYFLLNENYTAGVSGKGIKSIAFNLDAGEPTSIFNLTNERQEDRNGIFDLSGRRVAKPGKGIYIKDGQKVLIK